MRAAIIGAGFIADFHAEGYQAAGAELAAVCDTNGERARQLAEKYGCRAYADAEEMLQAERPEVVSVCVPTFLHEPCVLAALKAGANVLCEKPMALTMESCLRMEQAAQAAGRVLMTAQVLRWWPEYQAVARQLHRMGRPDFIATQRLQHASRTTWLAHPEKGGGALFDLFVHDLDFVCSLMGYEPAVESALGYQGEEDSWRSLCVTLRWPDGAGAKIEASNRMPPRFPFTAAFRADYPNACVDYRFQAPVNIQRDAKTDTSFLLFENGEAQPLPISPNAQSEAFRQEIAAFVNGVQAGQSPLPVSDTLRVMALVHQIKERLENR